MPLGSPLLILLTTTMFLITPILTLALPISTLLISPSATSTTALNTPTTTGFGDSCRDVHLEASFFGEPGDHYSRVHAQCEKDAGEMTSTQLNLNECIGNFDGELTWDARGGFAESCFDCRLRRHSSWKQFTVLHCICKRAGEKPPVWFPSHTELDLEHAIFNLDGELVAVNIPTQTSTVPSVKMTTVPKSQDRNDEM